MARCENLAQMEAKAFRFIAARNPSDKVAVIAAHHPIVFDPRTRLFAPATEPIQKGSFGAFTDYTASLGARLVRKGKEMGVVAKIALLVDDHSQVGEPEWFIIKDRLEGRQSFGLERRHPMLAEIMNGVAKAQEEYRLPECLAGNGIAESDMIVSRLSGKSVFFESQYRLKFSKDYPNEKTGCAGEVNLIYQELSEQGFNMVIAFFPERCRGPVCNAATQSNILLKSQGARQKRLIVALDTERCEEYYILQGLMKDIEMAKQRLELGICCTTVARPHLELLMDMKKRVEANLFDDIVQGKGGVFVHTE